jgi:O-antigen/teichoic acid export membrane protein
MTLNPFRLVIRRKTVTNCAPESSIAFAAGRKGLTIHLVESVMFTGIAQAFSLAIGLVSLRIITSIISTEELGAYFLLVSMTGLLLTFTSVGGSFAAERNLPASSSRTEAARLIASILWGRLGFLLLSCLIIALCKPLIIRLFYADSGLLFYHYLYALVPLYGLYELFFAFLRGLNSFKDIALIESASKLLRFTLLLVLLLGIKMGINGLFFAELFALAFALIAAAIMVGPLALSWPDGREAWKQIHFGLPLQLNSIMVFLTKRMETLIISGLAGPVAVSLYNVAGRVPQGVADVAASSLSKVLLPNMTYLLARSEEARLTRLLNTSICLTAYLWAMLALIVSLFRREIILLVAPASYLPAAPAASVLALALCFSALGNVMGTVIVAQGDNKMPVKITAVSGILNLVLNYFLIKRWGFMGAAWASLVDNVLAFGITHVVLLYKGVRVVAYDYLAMIIILVIGIGASFMWPDLGVPSRLGVVLIFSIMCLVASPRLRDGLHRVVEVKLPIWIRWVPTRS